MDTDSGHMYDMTKTHWQDKNPKIVGHIHIEDTLIRYVYILYMGLFHLHWY